MTRFSVFALLIAAAVGFTYASATAAPSVSSPQAKSVCDCTDCRCPDCNGGFCICDVCKCGDCPCLQTGSGMTTSAKVMAAAPAESCCSVAAKASVKTGCGY